MISRVKFVHIIIMGVFAVLFIIDVEDSGATDRGISEDVPNEAQKHLARDYVRATRTRDLEALRSLYYEPSILCRFYSEPEYIDQLLRVRLDADIPDEYEITVSEYVVSDEPSELDKVVGVPVYEYLVTPTHEIKLRFLVYDETKEFPRGWSTHAIRMLEKDGRWYFVLGCPGPGYSKFDRMRSRQKN